MIPTFPLFKKIEVEDRDAVEAYTQKYPTYSDFNFSSLWCWDINHRREISILNESLVVKFTDYKTGEVFLSYLGMQNNPQTTMTLLNYSESIGLPPVLKLLPEISIYDVEFPNLKIELDKANYDYMYLASRMAGLYGNQYKNKRQAANHYIRTHPNHTFEVHALSEAWVQDAVRSIALSWKERRDTSGDDQSIVHEMEAIENIFKIADSAEFIVGIVKTDGISTSFTLEEVANKIYSIAHFWKTANRVEAVSTTRVLLSGHVSRWPSLQST